MSQGNNLNYFAWSSAKVWFPKFDKTIQSCLRRRLGIIFAYSYNKFHATLTTRAQNTISAPTCMPETRFCCLQICGWDSGQPFVKSPGSSNTRPPCTYMKDKFPTPVNCLLGKFPGVSRGGGDGYSRNWLMHKFTSAAQTVIMESI
jgi:hypothetical protein